MCEHQPGAIYDDMKMVLIAGNFFYDEYSVANSPADRHSKVLELYYNGNTKNIEIKNEHAGDTHEVRPEFPQYDSDSEEDNLSMTVKKEEKKQEIKDSANVEKISDENKEPKVEKKEEVKDEKKAEEPKVEETIDQFFDRLEAVEKITDEDNDKLYDFMWEGLDESIVKDAKLSTAKRKKLAKSTFCGPDRSFPVNDCAHYTAALRLLGRYKGPGDKGKIKACIERKGKAMGCAGKKKDNMEHARMLHAVTSVIEEHMWMKPHLEKDGKEALLQEEEVKGLSSILKRLAGMVGKDSFVKALSDSDMEELKDVVKVFQDADLLDEIVKLEETLGEVREEFDEVKDGKQALKEEYDLLQSEVDSVRDELVTVKGELRDRKVEKLNLYMVLKDGEISEEQVAGLAELTDEVIDNQLENLINEVDIKKITDKLSDGTSRVPEGSIENPVAKSEVEIMDVERIKKTLQDLSEGYIQLSFKSKVEANTWLNIQMAHLVNRGQLPQELSDKIKENILKANN
jgi:hypothetical protein